VEPNGKADQEDGLDDRLFSIASYRPVNACDGFSLEQLREHQLPTGFPLLYDRASGALVEPVFGYLYNNTVRYRHLNLASAYNAADNLRLWWGYLWYRKLEWDQVSSYDIEAYRRLLNRMSSRLLKMRIAEGTVKQRLSAVISFYKYANRCGFTRISTEFLENPGNTKGGTPSTARIRALTYDEWARLRPYVGPLPSDPDHDPITRPSRSRLTYELMLQCSLRRKEFCGLTVDHVRALCQQLEGEGDDFRLAAVQLTTVKGGPARARHIVMAAPLIRELESYLKGPERKAAASIFTRNGGEEPTALFLNHATSRRDPGKPLTPKRVSAISAALMRQAGMVECVEVTDEVTGTVETRKVPLHRLHDMRHTAAVWRYMAERAAGNPEPWVSVQIMLGHSLPETTKQFYLRISNLFEAQTSDGFRRFLRAMAYRPEQDAA
jgi:integrase